MCIRDRFNPIEISNNLKKNGGFIPGFRPGKPTSDFIRKVLNKVTLFGAIYLGIVAILPLIIGKVVNVSALSIGGTSVIIVVGVALETVQALESQMLMRQYKGFLDVYKRQPLPTPNSVICSPIHMTKEEPAMKDTMITSAAQTEVFVRMP